MSLVYLVGMLVGVCLLIIGSYAVVGLLFRGVTSVSHGPAPRSGVGEGKAVPKCLHCGHVGPWKVEPLFLPRHFVVALLLLVVWGAGLLYLFFIWLIRMNPDRRSKSCTQCKARNMFSFVY